MYCRSEKHLVNGPQPRDELAPERIGAHLIQRTGAPPLRIVGARVFHKVGGGKRFAPFISLWSMRSPGFVLVHSLPDQGGDARVAVRVDGLDCAADALERYCADLAGPRPRAAGGTTWDTSLNAALVDARIGSFVNLVGHVLAEWHEAVTSTPPEPV